MYVRGRIVTNLYLYPHDAHEGVGLRDRREQHRARGLLGRQMSLAHDLARDRDPMSRPASRTLRRCPPSRTRSSAALGSNAFWYRAPFERRCSARSSCPRNRSEDRRRRTRPSSSARTAEPDPSTAPSVPAMFTGGHGKAFSLRSVQDQRTIARVSRLKHVRGVVERNEVARAGQILRRVDVAGRVVHPIRQTDGWRVRSAARAVEAIGSRPANDCQPDLSAETVGLRPARRRDAGRHRVPSRANRRVAEAAARVVGSASRSSESSTTRSAAMAASAPS